MSMIMGNFNDEGKVIIGETVIQNYCMINRVDRILQDLIHNNQQKTSNAFFDKKLCQNGHENLKLQ